jgi:hypothetical protein
MNADQQHQPNLGHQPETISTATWRSFEDLEAEFRLILPW